MELKGFRRGGVKGESPFTPLEITADRLSSWRGEVSRAESAGIYNYSSATLKSVGEERMRLLRS